MKKLRERSDPDEHVRQFINDFIPFRRSSSTHIFILNKPQNTIDFTECFTRHTTKAGFVFTVINAAVYHFTRSLTFIALTYFITAFVFCMIYLLRIS